MNLPLKLRHGDTLATLYDKFNAVVDYLTRTRIVAGSGIRVSQLPAGQTIESTATAAGGSATAAPAASGMFRVTENVNTVTITGGLAFIGGTPEIVPAGTLTRTSPNTQLYVLLVRPYGGVCSFAFGSTPESGYNPGGQVCWPLARLTDGGVAFTQLWQGGMIDFALRYYMG